MPAVPITELLSEARSQRIGLGAMNVVLLEHAEAIVAGAEQAGRPVVLQISQNAVAYHGSLAPLARATLQLASQCSVPLSVHLDHATDVSLVKEAVGLGIRSVMFDASTLPHADNVAATAEVVRWCHERGAAVEAALGQVGGRDGVHAASARTEPQEAADYVAATGVNALAVAVGSSSAMPTREPQLDDELIAALAAQAPVPLVLHGSSGVPDAGLVSAIAAGMTKINIATHLDASLTRAVRAELAADPAMVDPRRYVGAGRTAVTAEVARLLSLFAAATGEP